MINKLKNIIAKIYNALFILSPFFILAGLLQTNFQKFLPYTEYFKGKYFWDFYTITDFFIALLILIFLIGFFIRAINFQKRIIPKEFLIAILLIFIAGALEIFLQKTYEPILTSRFEYFRTMLVYPIAYAFLIYKTLDEKTIGRLIKSYILMAAFFCAIALIQYFSGIFPGAQQDFMGRLVWPYIDPFTLKWQSANWAAFFTAPALVISFVKIFNAIKTRKFNAEFCLFLASFVLASIVIYFVQSYGAYAGIFIALAIYLFRTLKLKRFAIGFLIMLIIGAGIFFIQKNSMKYKVMTGAREYRYENSINARSDILKMNFSIIKNHPFLGVGLNQYQSYFAQNAEKILGKRFNEISPPPHAHNFFLSMWASLGILGFLGALILIIGIFCRAKFNPANPAIFALTAIMIHGLLDSYYWKPEIAYTVWFVIVLAYLSFLSLSLSSPRPLSSPWKRGSSL